MDSTSRGSAGASACSGFKPMNPAPRGAAQRISICKIAEIADAPIVVRSQRVELHGDSPQRAGPREWAAARSIAAAEMMRRQCSAAAAAIFASNS